MSLKKKLFARRLLIIAFILLSISAPVVVGAVEFEDTSPLRDYLDYAEEHNPGLQSARLKWKSALQKIPQATSLPEPKLSYAHFIEEVETRVGPQEQKIGLRQKFPFPGKLDLRGRLADANAEALFYSYQSRKQDLYYRVKSSYSEYYNLGRSIAITRDNMEILKNLEEVLRSRYATNQSRYSDLIKAQVELGKLDDRLKSFLRMRPALRARLNAALNRAPEAEIPFPRQLEENEIKFSRRQLQTMAREVNPELVEIKSRIEQEKIR